MVRLASLLLSCCSLLAQSSSTFRVEADFIKVPVSAFDSEGKMVLNLSREDFLLLDEGEARSIENFLLDTSPIRAVLLLDVSSSLQEELEEIRQAALRFAQAFSKEDLIAVMSFSDQLELLQDFTNDRDALRRSLKHLRGGYRTLLYDSLLATVRERLSSLPGKRVIILLTDGMDNQSRSSFDEVLRMLTESDISLYIVSRTRLVQPAIRESSRVVFLNEVMKNVLEEDTDFVEVYFREKETSLVHLAESTGGRVFFPQKLAELRGVYGKLATELKSQYILTFRPPSSSLKRFRSIKVFSEKVERLHHRKQYAWIKAGP